MSDSKSIAERHRRTRSDHAHETAEDYVEAIDRLQSELGRCRVVDLAEQFAVSHVTVTKVVARLKRENLVEAAPYGPLTLTSLGRRLAAKSRQRHEVVHEFLSAIGVSKEIAAMDAEGIEHHVSPETLESLRRLTEAIKRNKPLS